MTFVSVLKILLFMGLLPCLVGSFPAICGYPTESSGSTVRSGWCVILLKCYLYGWFVLLALFEVVAVPIILLQKSFGLLFLIYMIAVWVVAFLSVLGATLKASPILQKIKNEKGERNCDNNNCNNARDKRGAAHWISIILWCVFGALVLFQMWFLITHQHYDGDDSYYVTQSVFTTHYDNMYLRDAYTELPLGRLDIRHALAALPIFISWVSTACDFPPAAMAHTVIAPIFTFVMYGIYTLIALHLFRNKADAKNDVKSGAMADEKSDMKIESGEHSSREVYAPLFLIFLSLWFLFASSSLYTTETFALTRTWQGKSAFGNLLIPMCILTMLQIYNLNYTKGHKKQAVLSFLFLALLGVVGGLFTTASVYLFSLIVFVFGFFAGISKKKFAISLCCWLSILPGLLLGAIYYVVR